MVEEEQEVFDIEVVDNHNFVVNGIVAHNCHRIGAREFLKSFTRFNAEYRLGLSATPKREDGLERLYYLHVSNNLIMHETTRNVGAFYATHTYFREKSWRRYGSYIPYKVQLVKNIVEDDDRNNLLNYKIMEAYNEGRSILILSERIVHLENMMDRVINDVAVMELTKKKKSNIVQFFGAQKITKKQRKEGIKQKTFMDPSREELKSARIIFATYSKAKEGVDVPQLDTLVFATPVSSRVTIEQSVGRIERFYTGKKAPKVIDIYDAGNNLLEAMANKRINIYDELGMRHILSNDKLNK